MVSIKLDLFDITFDIDAFPEFITKGISSEYLNVSGEQIKKAIINGEYRFSDNLTGMTKSDVLNYIGVTPQEWADAIWFIIFNILL